MNQMSARETVLIVDDDKINIDILAAALKDIYALGVATSGARVLQYVERALPDLILLDIVMPEMDGYEVCKSLKRNYRTKDIPIIFITGMTDTEDKAKGFELGAVDYITKPFDIVEVKARIRTHLALRQARAELEKINAELEVRVQKRTAELFEANLLLTREIAEHKKAEEERMQMERLIRQSEKMQALGTLAGGIAHDFNNILSSIIGYTDMVLEELPRDSPFSQDLHQVLEAGYRAKEMIKQILTFSRQSEEERKPLHLGSIVKEALGFLQVTLPKNIEILSNIEEEKDLVLADPTQVHQILMNLCTNAGHAMRKKGGVLEIDLSKAEVDVSEATAYPGILPGPYLKLTVSDTGHGMTRAVMDRVFDPYFTTKPVGEGTGMGLSIIHGIIENHGGAVTVSSELGKGATFRVLLPVIQSLESSTVESEKMRPVPGNKNERILLVDDELPLVRLWYQALQRIGYLVASRTTGIEALELFTKDPDYFDLIITDQVMLHMTGTELADAILKIRPDIPIIICTTYHELLTSGQAKAMGIREVVAKPISSSDLSRLVRTILDEGMKCVKKPETFH